MNMGLKLIYRVILDYILPTLGLFVMYTLMKFSRLHILYFPADIPLAEQEIVVLFLCLILLFLSMYHKAKLSRAIFFICIVWSLFNIAGFTVLAYLHYENLYLDQFI